MAETGVQTSEMWYMGSLGLVTNTDIKADYTKSVVELFLEAILTVEKSLLMFSGLDERADRSSYTYFYAFGNFVKRLTRNMSLPAHHVVGLEEMLWSLYDEDAIFNTDCVLSMGFEPEEQEMNEFGMYSGCQWLNARWWHHIGGTKKLQRGNKTFVWIKKHHSPGKWRHDAKGMFTEKQYYACLLPTEYLS
ncbi:hypothetical protein N0V90_002771 [Kalmusia sp. IMI 367209]|nr:hypothetical protein N0V90_002771 [Kalmusia sp. IMI 367209]